MMQINGTKSRIDRSMRLVKQMPVSVLCLGLAFAVPGCSRVEGDSASVAQQASTAAQSGVRITNVEVTPVTRTDFTSFIKVTGEVEALDDVVISAEETGRILRFYVVKGQRVQRGQRIAKIDDGFIDAQVREARAAAKLAQEEWERQRQLWEEDSMGTEMTYLQRKYQAEIAASRLAQLETRWGRTVIRAPISGVFDEKYLDLGEMAIPGAAVARIVSADDVKISAGVPERFVMSVNKGDSATVTFDIFPGREFVGRVIFVGSSVDQDSRTFPIEIVLANSVGIMKPAMVANVRVQREHLDSVIIVPQHVVLRSATGYKVFVAVEDDYLVARARPVTLGAVSGNDVVIEDGLEEGDLLITVGQQLVDSESRIRLVNPDSTVSMGGAN